MRQLATRTFVLTRAYFLSCVCGSVIGEESVSDGGSCVLTDTPTWMVDPIDGTMNFIHR